MKLIEAGHCVLKSSSLPTQPFFSVVIPSLGQGKFIEACLSSVFNQDIEPDDMEVIVQDGGSTDETIDILRQHEPKIDWVSEQDQGQSDAINRAIRRSRGEWIAWINTDDAYASEDVLSTIKMSAKANPDAEIIFGHGRYFDQEGKLLRPYLAAKMDHPREELLLAPSSPIPQPGVFFKRSLFDAVGGLDESLHWCMDFELWLRMFPKAKQTIWIDKVIANQTLHEDAKSIAGMKKQIREVGRVKSQHFSVTKEPVFAARVWASQAYLWTYYLYCRFGKASCE